MTTSIKVDENIEEKWTKAELLLKEDVINSKPRD
jgi:hypothetical protein